MYDAGNDVRILMTGPAASTVCTQTATSLSSNGDFWSLQPHSPTGELATVCVMTQRGISAEVQDSGERTLGQSLCSNLLSAGWSEDTRAESSQSAAVQSSSAASSSAAAQAQLQAKAARDVGTLTTDTATVTAADLDKDLQTTNGDLATTRTDASQGPGDNCVNASTTVYNDAATTLYNDSVTAAANDAISLKQDEDSLRTDNATVQRDQQQLAASALPAWPGAASAITTAGNAISATNAKANADLDAINTGVDTGYQIANNLATGACAGTGPGAPPTHLQHI